MACAECKPQWLVHIICDKIQPRKWRKILYNCTINTTLYKVCNQLHCFFYQVQFHWQIRLFLNIVCIFVFDHKLNLLYFPAFCDLHSSCRILSFKKPCNVCPFCDCILPLLFPPLTSRPGGGRNGPHRCSCQIVKNCLFSPSLGIWIYQHFVSLMQNLIRNA